MLLAVALYACGGHDASPEKVVQQYAQWVNTGQIEQAKSVCTPAGVAYLDALAAVITSTEGNLDSSVVTIESVQCTLGPNQQTAQCKGWIDDGYERYQETYVLQLHEGEWHIDHQPEQGTLQSSEEELPAEESNQTQ